MICLLIQTLRASKIPSQMHLGKKNLPDIWASLTSINWYVKLIITNANYLFNKCSITQSSEQKVVVSTSERKYTKKRINIAESEEVPWSTHNKVALKALIMSTQNCQVPQENP